MATTINDAVCRIAELWGEVPSAREMRWLWMYLKFFRDDLPNQFSQFRNTAVGRTIKPQGQFLGGDIEFELVNLLERHAALVPTIQLGRFFTHLEDFDWIDESDIRQLHWLIDRLHEGLNLEVPDARARLSDRDYFICLVDLVALPVTNKKTYLSNLFKAWMSHLKNTSYLNWFSNDDKDGRCDFAWQILESRLESTLLNSFQSFSVIGQQFRTHQGGVSLKCYFDSLHVSDFEKKSHVDHVKRLWSQRKYREKLEKNKVRQRNFVLSDATIKNLDKLAKELDVSRTEALERLIELAARHGMPFAGKI